MRLNNLFLLSTLSLVIIPFASAQAELPSTSMDFSLEADSNSIWADASNTDYVLRFDHTDFSYGSLQLADHLKFTISEGIIEDENFSASTSTLAEIDQTQLFPKNQANEVPDQTTSITESIAFPSEVLGSTNAFQAILDAGELLQQELCGSPSSENEQDCVDALADQYGMREEQLQELLLLTLIMLHNSNGNEKFILVALGGYESVLKNDGTVNNTDGRNQTLLTNLIAWSDDKTLSEATRLRAIALLVKLYSTRPEAVKNFIIKDKTVKDNDSTLKESLKAYYESQKGDDDTSKKNRSNAEALASAAGISLK